MKSYDFYDAGRVRNRLTSVRAKIIEETIGNINIIIRRVAQLINKSCYFNISLYLCCMKPSYIAKRNVDNNYISREFPVIHTLALFTQPTTLQNNNSNNVRHVEIKPV